jgi:ceramide glucosyltransferase
VSLVHIAVAATAVSSALYGLMLALFARAVTKGGKARVGVALPLRRALRVTIFKPLAGSDDDLEENLASFARIDYPSFEILFGVADVADPAYAVARRFIAKHPKVDARLVVTDPGAAVNPKVAQLIGLEEVATGEVYVISDSNVRVVPTYLASLIAEFDNDHVGMVTSIFAGTGERTLGAALENLQLCASTAPGLAAMNTAMNTVSRRQLTVGKSMAVRRRDLERLGGFQSVGHVLAEDHVLGQRIFEAGLQMRTSFAVVENRNVTCSVARTLERHTRWAKMRRSLMPVAFLGEPVLTPIVVASLGVLLAPGKVTAAILVAVCVAQTACALLAVRLLRGRTLAWWYAPLEIVRSYVSLLCWAAACVNRRIAWRGHPFVLLRGSVIVPVNASDTERAARRARLAA